MRGYLTLVEQDALFRIEPGSDVGSRHLADGAAQFLRILPDGNRVQIDNAIHALVRFLQLDPLQHGTQIVSQVQAAGRLHAGKDTFLQRHFSIPQIRGALWPAAGPCARVLRTWFSLDRADRQRSGGTAREPTELCDA